MKKYVFISFFLFSLSVISLSAQIPKDGDKWYGSGKEAREIGDYTLALRFFETALRHEGDSIKILTAMGLCKHDLNKFSAATWYFETALKLDSVYLPAMSGFCLSSALAGEINEAIRVCDKAVSQYPDSLSSRLNRAKVWMKLEKPERALNDLELLSSNFPQNLSVMLTHGLALYELGKYQSAANYFEHVINLQETHAFGHHNLGMTFMALGKNEEALQAYNQAIRFNADLSPALFNRGLLKIGMQQERAGCLDLQKAKELDKSLAEEAYNRFCK